MEVWWNYFTLWGPYGLGSLAAGLLGYGIVSGFLLRGPSRQAIARPFYMSAFFMALTSFIVAMLETRLGTLRPYLTLAVALMAVIYGAILVRLALRRPLARVRSVTFVVLQSLSLALPLLVGLAGTLRQESWLVETIAGNVPLDQRADYIARFWHTIWVPIEAGGVAAIFLLSAFFIMLRRRARELPRV